jgi:drug/metabolite transporter (DMT)-like permease
MEKAISKPQTKQMGILSGLGAAAIWGGMYVVSKVVLEVIPPFALITLRLVLGILVLWLIVALRGGTGFTRRQTLQVVAVGWVGYGVSLGFQFVGTKLSTASNGALVTSSTPAFVLLFAAWLLSEPVTRRRLVALGVSSLGVLAVIDPRAARLSPDLFWGNLSLVAAAVTWALYSVLIRKVTRSLDTLPVSLVAFWGGLLVTVPAGAWEISTQGVGPITPGIIAGVLFLGIISTALAMFLWNYAFATLEAGVASLTLFAQPVVGATLGAFFLGERLTPLFLLGGLLIGIGLWLAAGE